MATNIRSRMSADYRVSPRRGTASGSPKKLKKKMSWKHVANAANEMPM